MSAELIHGDARRVSDVLEPNSVSLICTSPPYFALRSYQDGGEHYDGQIGSEPTPTEFVDALIACTADWMKVMRPDGSIWVNLGDKYAGSGGGNQSGINGTASQKATALAMDHMAAFNAPRRYNQASDGIAAKSLMGLPWRYALRCIDELGLILRAEVIWSKPNGLPESVTDRVRRSHEQWFHFTLNPRYYAAVDEIREEAKYPDDNRHERGGRRSITPDGGPGGGNTSTCNPLGKLPGSVWTVPTEPLRVPADLGVDHFAAFPSEWPRRIILGWSPPGICTACGQGRRPIVEKEMGDNPTRPRQFVPFANGSRNGVPGSTLDADKSYTIVGYACDCPDTSAPTTPAVVCDPFGGTGTVAVTAHHLGRHGVHFDLSRDYLRLAQWRLDHDTALRDKVLNRSGIARPADPAIDGQMDLFGGAA